MSEMLLDFSMEKESPMKSGNGVTNPLMPGSHFVMFLFDK